MINRLCLIFLLALFRPGSAALPETASDRRDVLGWVEWITIEPWGFKVKARLDTGALTASMHAEDIVRFVRDNKAWVRFVLELQDGLDKDGNRIDPKIEVELPVERDALIKQHDGRLDRRPVVVMTYCLNRQRLLAEFSLKDRSELNYPVLLGRSALQDIALVDPAEAFLGAEGCPASD